MITDEELKQYGCIRKEDIQEHIVHNMAYEIKQLRDQVKVYEMFILSYPQLKKWHDDWVEQQKNLSPNMLAAYNRMKEALK